MTLNERTAGYLADEVRKAQAEFDAATAQMREFEARREAAQIKLEALKHALGPGAPSGPRKEVSASQADLLGGSAAIQGTAVVSPAVGFRSAIRVVLSSADKGLRVMEVFERLKEHGIAYQGKTNPSIRTSNELRRMVREGHARKRGRLYYAIREASVNGGSPS